VLKVTWPYSKHLPNSSAGEVTEYYTLVLSDVLSYIKY